MKEKTKRGILCLKKWSKNEDEREFVEFLKQKYNLSDRQLRLLITRYFNFITILPVLGFPVKLPKPFGTISMTISSNGYRNLRHKTMDKKLKRILNRNLRFFRRDYTYTKQLMQIDYDKIQEYKNNISQHKQED